MEQRRIERYFGRMVRAIYGRIVRQQKDNKIHVLNNGFYSPIEKILTRLPEEICFRGNLHNLSFEIDR